MPDTRRLKSFPIERFQLKRARFNAELVFNPFARIPPVLWYGFVLEFSPLHLGRQAYAPEVFGRVLETRMELGGIEFPFRRWSDIEGEFGSIPDRGASSVYVSNAHNPIDVRSLEMRRRRGARWDVRADVFIDLECERSGYGNVEAQLAFGVTFGGISFPVPVWTSKPRFPKSWRIPKVFDQRSVDELIGRFVDLDVYRRKREGDAFSYVPVGATRRTSLPRA